MINSEAEPTTPGTATPGTAGRAAEGAGPVGRMALVTCMDPRIQLLRPFGVAAADAFVLRNGGGRVTDDVLRGLVLCTRLLDVTEIGVLHHTDCRLQGLSNDELVSNTGVDIDFLPITDVADSVRADVGQLRSCGLIGDEVRIWGGLYDVDSHTVSVIA